MVVIMSEGASTQYPAAPEMLDQKMSEAREALARLGGSDIRFVGLPDMELTRIPSAQLNAPVEQAVEDFRPDWVLTHSASDLNSDHRAVHEAARVATRPKGTNTPALLHFEVPSATEFGYAPHAPHVFVTLSEVDVEAKLSALSAYKSEKREWPHGRSAKAVKSWLHVRGSTCGVPYAEAFTLSWSVVG